MSNFNNSKIVPHTGLAFYGDMQYNHGRVKGVTEYCMELFLRAPVPHFMSTFIFFYLKNPLQENPVTCSAYGRTLSVHPGQGRLIASYLQGKKSIKTLLIPLHDTDEEIEFLHEIATNVKKYKRPVYAYENQNHKGISTAKFRDYFYPTPIRLKYEQAKQTILDEKLQDLYPIEFLFHNRESIVVGRKENEKIKTRIMCNNPQGLFEFIAFRADGKYKKSDNYKIL